MALIDFFSGRFFWKGQTDRFNAESYIAFLSDVLAQTTRASRPHPGWRQVSYQKAMKEFFAAHADRLTRYQLPSYSPDFNPIEYLWKKVKKRATHLKYFAEFADSSQKVDETMQQFANLPSEITSLMGLYCESLGQAS